MNFSGTHPYTLDAKGRLAVPARFRDELIQAGALESLILVPGLQEPHLKLLPEKAWQKLETSIEQIGNPIARRAFKRTVFARSHAVTMDNQGRILVPQSLREFAKLDGEILIIGEGDHLQIWSPKVWGQVLGDAMQVVQGSEALLAELGF